MKIGVFAYNFPHWKTQNGIFNLMISSFKPDVIFAADSINLNIPKPTIRIVPKDLFLIHPKKIAEKFNIDYHVVTHNSLETSKLVKKYNLDLGIILGARILKPATINNFKIGVLNLHPGILPENRGLDNIKWAIENNLPQGVTAHLIDSKIDRGFVVQKKIMNIYEDDCLLDLFIRIQNLEQELMISSLEILSEGEYDLIKSGAGNYFKTMPHDIEEKILEKFEFYKKNSI